MHPILWMFWICVARLSQQQVNPLRPLCESVSPCWPNKLKFVTLQRFVQVAIAMPQFACDEVCTAHPHAGLICSWLIHRRCALQHKGPVGTSSILPTQAVKKVSKDSIQDQAPVQINGCPFWPPQNAQNKFCCGWCNTSYRCGRVILTWMTICATGMPILHAEASFISAERGLRQEILSQTSLKWCIHFGFIPKLVIFICKQLKRPVAFGAVQEHVWQTGSKKCESGRGCEEATSKNVCAVFWPLKRRERHFQMWHGISTERQQHCLQHVHSPWKWKNVGQTSSSHNDGRTCGGIRVSTSCWLLLRFSQKLSIIFLRDWWGSSHVG